MRVSQHGWTGYRGAHSPAPLLLLYVLYAPLSLFLLATPPLAQGAIQIPKGLSQPPVMSEMPESFIAFSLEDIILPCEATAIPNATFRWVKDGKEFGPERTGSGTWFAEGEEPLSFYQGVYRCYASNTLGTAMSPAIRLITETQPIPPKRQGSWKTAQEGDSLILPCNPPNSSSTPLIHWMDRKMVHIKQSERVVVGQDGNMYFAHVMKTDSRHKYICNAQYPDARIILPKEPISLTVTTSNDASPARKPHLFLPHGTHTSKKALKDHSLILECIPKGLPTPKVEWRKKDGSLAETGGKVDTHGRWLNFESIALEDDGEYECKATNEHGSVTHSFTVTVEAEPYWVKQPESLLYAPGETVRLECQADGIPTPAIIWNINGQPVTEVDEDPRRRASGGVLILRDVAFGDTAVYQCEATNEHGNILINTYIYVIELPPQILSNDGEVYRVAEGKVAKLPCDVFGSPLPHVTWDGEGSLPLLSDPRVALMTNGMLELSNASRDDRGAYTCTIRNTNISITAYLEVLNRTVMLAGPHHVRVFRGNSSQLDCRFYMDPQLKQPQINWKRDGHKLVLDPSKYTVLPNGTLLMTNLELKDSGQYSCEVLTEVDDVEANGIVTVIDCPEPPYGLALYDIQDRSLTLSWLLVPSHNSPITDFIVEAQEAQHTEEVQGNWEKWKHVSGDVNHLELTLQPYSKYRFRVIGVNEVGPSKPSEESESHGTPPAVPDTNPSHVRSNSLDSGTLIIEWEEMEKRKHNGPGFQYKVSWRLSEGQSQHWNHSYALAPPFLVNGTEPYSPFEIKVQAVNTQGEGLAPIAEIGYSGEGVPLEAPGEVEVTVMNSTVRVTWEHAQRVQGLLLGYKIYIKRLGYQGERGRRALGQMHNDREREGREEEEDEESRAVEVLGMKTSAEVPGLRLYSRYEVSVAVFNSKDDGPRSQPEPFSTPEGAPGPPASLTLESPSETELTLHWTPPIQTNGILLEYIVQYQREVENKDVKMSIIRDPTRTYLELDNLDPHSGYIFKVSGRTAAGDGPPITKKGSTLLDGVPPSNITLVAGETSVNFSWVPGTRYRNHAFQFQYLRKGGTVGAQWEESDFVDTSQGFFPLIGLQPGTKYHFIITHANHTHWDQEIQTSGPELSEVAGGFATQGWFIGLISAIVLLMLILLILCFIKRSKGGKYAVKDKEEGQVDSEAKPMKDETFGEYSDGDEKRTASQPSLCPESKLGSEDSLAEYGDSVDIQFNEDGSFIGQYSGRGPVPQGGNESSGPASPDNPVPPPPIAPSMSTILDRPS